MQTIKGLDKLLSDIKMVGKLKEEFGKEFLKRVQEKTPVRTGLLKDSWELDTTKAGRLDLKNTAKNEQGDNYVVFVEFGTMHFTGFFMVSQTILESRDVLKQAKKNVGL
jgi:hypothetical protein